MTIRRTLAAVTTLALAAVLGRGEAQVGTYSFTIGDLAKYLKYQDRVNTFKCGARVQQILEPEILRARGVILSANTVELRIPWRPTTWKLSANGRGRALPLQAAEVVFNDGSGKLPLRTLGGKQYLRYDRAQGELKVALRVKPDGMRGVVGQVIMGDGKCSAHILFTVVSTGPG